MKGDGIDLELTANGARKEEQENKALEWSETPLATVFPPTSPLPHPLFSLTPFYFRKSSRNDVKRAPVFEVNTSNWIWLASERNRGWVEVQKPKKREQ